MVKKLPEVRNGVFILKIKLAQSFYVENVRNKC